MATSVSWAAGAWRGAHRFGGVSANFLSKAAVVPAPSSLKIAAIEQRGFFRSSCVRASTLHAGSSFSDKMSIEKSKSAIVSVEWLHQNLNLPHVKVLDASWYMPAEQRNPLEEFKKCRIPGALFFDIDGIVDDKVDLPHMLPVETAFAAALSALDLQNTDTIVAYDGKGIFSSARVWWMFRVFGHKNVYVLDGGLPKWLASSYPVDSSVPAGALSKIEASVAAVRKPQAGVGGFKTSFQQSLVWSLEQVKKNVEERTFQHIDARSKPRFYGAASEPRKGIRAGHVPGSKCIPFTEVLNQEGMLLPINGLQKTFEDAGLNLEVPVVASCGTGVTACVLSLALYQLGVASVPVYDGSWTEWGGLPDSEVAVATSSA
ncbi:thiosulfate/3-mercaptopyruvate sulfurtransferase 1, mitochondrial isoform X1 [Selaginella moellendorffii]|uniref:thiosulfate/3-mercaptopyruvate sulfurtransferase 1, mitochondrial isoform X1 n=1 Tax=Selaginella moellendorffii TaxID=88036 RepID=UPI000D1CB5DF|nr:thiosulfate/3-mercaptopyruvate sulfurtransferase 1, mitochondrial isoform X1 [Selaginella moellendorffii]|eukprot:XP_024528939.1 thiosulfate/3-mercaptopyruvate sulfurtransferase 1, mitochondrial isoform X1 [Selaginella moellendorffii]